MADVRLRLLLDQNVPREIAAWIRSRRPTWLVSHAGDVGLAGKSDRDVLAWVQQHKAIVITLASGAKSPSRCCGGLAQGF